MPRPIPDDVGSVTGWSWYLLPVPDHPVFIEAAWDAFSELAYPWNWGKEGYVAESDVAAQLWADALYEALRVRDMGFPDSILEYIDEVEALLRQIQQTSGCCENLAPIDETQTFDGDYPATAPGTWGDGEVVADSDDWQELVCGAAHAYVDHLKAMNNQLELVIAGGAIVIGAIAGLLGLLSGAGLLAAVSWGTASGLVGALVALGSGAAFAGVDEDIEAARNDIVCAIYQDASASALSAAIESAVGSLAWTSFYSWVDYDTAVATMLTGSLGNSDLPVVRRTDCNCSAYLDLAWTYDADLEGWTGGAVYGAQNMVVPDGNFTAIMNKATARTQAGLPLSSVVRPTSITFRLYIRPSEGMRLTFGPSWSRDYTEAGGYARNVWHDIVVDLTGVPSLTLDDSGNFLTFNNKRLSAGAYDNIVDDVHIQCEDAS